MVHGGGGYAISIGVVQKILATSTAKANLLKVAQQLS